MGQKITWKSCKIELCATVGPRFELGHVCIRDVSTMGTEQHKSVYCTLPFWAQLLLLKGVDEERIGQRHVQSPALGQIVAQGELISGPKRP